ncbi:MAG TPA: hypothetical protein VF533_03290, partial [Solirubrobacteraceae bacterium]
MNRDLTSELRDAVGADAVLVPAGRADPAHAAHAGSRPGLATLVRSPFALAFAVTAAGIAGIVVALVWDVPASVPVGVAILLLALYGAVRLLGGLLAEPEHPDPETAARL